MKVNPKVVDLYHGDTGSLKGGAIDWAALKGAGIVGVIHKASQGTTDIDPQYAARRKAATAAGLLWGAYHFGTSADGGQQAKHFLSAAQPDKDTLVAIDFEDFVSEMTLAGLQAFIEGIHTALGRFPVLYSGNLIKEKIAGRSQESKMFFAQCRFWLAQYGSTPRLIDSDNVALPWKDAWLWQFTGDGAGPQPHTIPGLHGDIDISSFNGTDEELATQWAD